MSRDPTRDTSDGGDGRDRRDERRGDERRGDERRGDERRDARGRLLVPEQDRRRDPRDDPAILDLGSVRELDGDNPEGWADPVALSAGFGGGGGGGGGAGAVGEDWTELVAPDLAPDPLRDGAREVGPEFRRRRGDSERYDSMMRGDDED